MQHQRMCLCLLIIFYGLIAAPIFVDGLILLGLEGDARHMGAGLLTNFSALSGIIWVLFWWLLIYGLIFLYGFRLYIKICCFLRVGGVLSSVLFLILLVLFTYSLSLYLFPVSGYSYIVGFVPLHSYIFLLGCGVLGVGGVVDFMRSSLRGKSTYIATLCVFLTPFIGGYIKLGVNHAIATESEDPNIIIIGVDSLSMAAFDRHREELVEMNRLVSAGKVYERAYTNIGRTYPAWVTLLTGEYPVKNGAFFNLRNTEASAANSNLAHALGAAGYHTVYAMDERRFSNLDESFGFDRIVGPRLGAVDFIVQPILDTPATNLLLQWPGSRYIFPWSWNNTAAYASYSAKGFVSEILTSIKSDRPNFLAVHFETAHFPFRTRHSPSATLENDLWASYVRALQVVDTQVGHLMNGLKSRGLLEHALIVFISDHGEGLGEVEAIVFDTDGDIAVSSFGHGVDLLSDHQNRIVLSLSLFKGGVPVLDQEVLGDQVSLLDIRSAVKRYLYKDEVSVEAKSPCVYVETGIRFSTASDYRNLDEKSVANQAAEFYSIDKAGRMVLREQRLSELVEEKDIGVRCADRVTWYSARKGSFLSYGLDERGLPVAKIEPSESDISYIYEYINMYRSVLGFGSG